MSSCPNGGQFPAVRVLNSVIEPPPRQPHSGTDPETNTFHADKESAACARDAPGSEEHHVSGAASISLQPMHTAFVLRRSAYDLLSSTLQTLSAPDWM